MLALDHLRGGTLVGFALHVFRNPFHRMPFPRDQERAMMFGQNFALDDIRIAAVAVVEQARAETQQRILKG